MTNPIDELKRRFPYMFLEPNLGINIAKGWSEHFEKLCVEIDQLLGQDKMGFHFTQCKEKFGEGRFYFRWGRNTAPMRVDIQTPNGVLSFRNDPISRRKPRPGDDVKRKVEELIAALESDTRSTCIVCSAPGKLHSHEGYLLVLCADHTRQRESKTGLTETPWFD